MDGANRGDATEDAGDATEGEAIRGDVLVQRLWSYGLQHGLTTQRDLAQHLGITEETMRKWRHGLAAPSRSLIHRVADKTGLRAAWLETGEGEMMRRSAQKGTADAEPQQLARLQDQVALDDLVLAFESAQRQFAARGVTAPEPRKLLALTLALYDAAMQTLAEESPPAAAPDVAAKA